MRLSSPCSLLCAALIAGPASAQAPAFLGYQGRVLTSTGTPVTGTTALGFAVFSAATGGTALWSETQSLALSDGFYATFLGDATPAGCSTACTGVPAGVFDGSRRWLELTVNGTALTPRQEIASVAYALYATASFNVVGGSVNASTISINGTTVIDSSGHLVADGGVFSQAFGTGAGNVCQGNDPRLSDARTPTGAASGDLGGTYPGPTVVGLRGVALSSTAPSVGQFLGSTGTTWAPTALPLATSATAGVSIAGAGLDVTAGTFSVKYGAVAGTAVQGDALITSPVTLSVGSSGTYASLAAALASLDTKILRATVTISIAAGTYSSNAVIDVHHPDGRYLRIVGDETTPANVVLTFPSTSGFKIDNATLGYLSGVTVTGTAAGGALTASRNATVTLHSSVRFTGWGNGVLSLSGSHIEANGVQVVGAGANGSGFLADGATIQADNSQVTNFVYGYIADRGGSLQANSAKATNFSAVGVYALRSSHAWVPSATMIGNGASTCVVADYGGSVDARNTSASSCPNAFVSSNNGTTYANAASIGAGVTTGFSPPTGTSGNNDGVMQTN